MGHGRHLCQPALTTLNRHPAHETKDQIRDMSTTTHSRTGEVNAPTAVTREPRRLRVSIPMADVSANKWLDEQESISRSLRVLIRESIQRDGYIDVVNYPIGQLQAPRTEPKPETQPDARPEPEPEPEPDAAWLATLEAELVPSPAQAPATETRLGIGTNTEAPPLAAAQPVAAVQGRPSVQPSFVAGPPDSRQAVSTWSKLLGAFAQVRRRVAQR